ncbi:MAG: carbohydrate ABC transporter permease [Chitinispirillia bacterium]|jgi:multiple sugar transport system permease protein
MKSATIKIMMYMFLVTLFIICIIPFYLMLINGTRSAADINTGVTFIPGKYLIENFKTISSELDFFTGLKNTAFICTAIMIISSYVAGLTAFSIVFYDYRFKKTIFAIILGTLMIPQTLGLIGYFDLCVKLNILDTLMAIVFSGCANASSVFFLKQYTESVIPPAIIQAARVDGASELGIYHRIGIPMMLPGMASIGIFAFVFNWNNYILPLTIISSEEKYTISMTIQKLNSTVYFRDYGAVYLGIGLSIIPIIIVFSIFSKAIIQGIAGGSVKE